jgi:hypothetical protein
MTSVPPIKSGKLKTVIENICPDADLSFEFIIATLFPTCWTNIQKDLKDKYTQGYIAGQRDCAAIVSPEDEEWLSA